MPLVTISISPEQVSHLRQAVECGAYASDSEAVRDALVMWCEARRRQSLPPVSPARGMGVRHSARENMDVAHLRVGEMFSAYRPGSA